MTRNTHSERGLADWSLIISLPAILLSLLIIRPPAVYYTLLLGPISLAAVLYRFRGGTLTACTAIVGMLLLVGTDPDAVRRGLLLAEAWPILATSLIAGPLIGWLASQKYRNEQIRLEIAIEHARRFGNDHRRVQQLAAIGEAAQEIAAALDLRRTLRLVMEKAVATLPLDAGAIFQYKQEDNAYHVAVSHHLSEDHVRKITFGFADGVPGWVVEHRTSLIIEDARSDPRVHPFILEEGVCSVLAVPLVARGQVVGVLNLYRIGSSPPFGHEDRQLAQTFAAQAAYAIENARLVGELREAARELEARVQRRTRQLKESQAHVVRTEKLAVVGRLATSVAHEVNNPLQAIMLQLELLEEEGRPVAQSRRLRVVQEEVTRISEIVQRLLDFQRPKKGHSRLLDTAGLLNEVLELAGKKAQTGGVTLELCAAPLLPMVEGSGDQLKQVFLNLVLNAVEAMSGGGKLLIDLHKVSENVEIRFIDTGPGMPPEVLTRLFEPFFTTKSDGTGLGLAISHEIVTQHKGRLSAQSAPGEGSTFLITLPALPLSADARIGESSQ